MLAAYADENVALAVVDGLRRNGMDVVTAQDRGQRATDDEFLLATAAAEDRLFLTNDVDLLRIDSAWASAGRRHAGIVYWKQQLSIGEAIRRILEYASQTSEAAAAGTVKFF